MKCIHGHYYSELDNHHICMHYNTYFEGTMTESPNDSDSTKEMRQFINSAKALFISLDSMMEDDEYPLDIQEELECRLMIAKKLLRGWMKVTEKDFASDERHALVVLTRRLLDGV